MDYNKAFLYFTFQRKEPLSGCEIVQSGIHHKGNGLRLKQPDRKKNIGGNLPATAEIPSTIEIVR
jgi:hypothetical protein